MEGDRCCPHFSVLCSRIRGVPQCPLLNATQTLLGLGKEFEANYFPAPLTGQQHQGGLLKNTEIDPAAFFAFLVAFSLCVPRLREDAGAAQQRGLNCSFSVF